MIGPEKDQYSHPREGEEHVPNEHTDLLVDPIDPPRLKQSPPPHAAQTHDVEQAQASEARDQNHGEGLKGGEGRAR